MRQGIRRAIQVFLSVAAATMIGGAASAQEPLKIRIGWSSQGHMIPFLYRKPEILKHYGKSYVVEPVNFNGSTPQIASFAAEETDLGVFAPLALTLAIHNAGLDVRVLADVHQDGVAGWDSTSFLVPKTAGIKTIADLKGKRLAINAIGSAAWTAMEAMFRKNGPLDKSEYTLVEANFPTIPAMLEEGKIDFGPVLQPWKLQLMKTGKYDILFASRDSLGPVSFTFLTGRTKFLEANRAALMDFFEDHVTAIRWFTDPANHTEAVKIVSDFMKIPVENLGYFFTQDDYYLDPWVFPNIPGIQSMADTSFELGLAPVKIDAAKYVDTSFVEEARRRIEARK